MSDVDLYLSRQRSLTDMFLPTWSSFGSPLIIHIHVSPCLLPFTSLSIHLPYSPSIPSPPPSLVPRSSLFLFFGLRSLPCIILKTNSRTKQGRPGRKATCTSTPFHPFLSLFLPLFSSSSQPSSPSFLSPLPPLPPSLPPSLSSSSYQELLPWRAQ